jgi:hypothetical protein
LGLGITIRPEIPRTTVASVSVVAIALVALGKRPILSRAAFGKPVALPVLPIGKTRPIALALTLALVRRPLDVGLRGGWHRLRLKPLLRLALRGRGESIRQRAEIAIVFHVVALAFSRRSRLAALCERLRGLRGSDKSKVMLRVLQIILRRDRISPRVGVSRKLEVFLGDMMRVPAYFDIRSI